MLEDQLDEGPGVCSGEKNTGAWSYETELVKFNSSSTNTNYNNRTSKDQS